MKILQGRKTKLGSRLKYQITVAEAETDQLHLIPDFESASDMHPDRPYPAHPHSDEGSASDSGEEGEEVEYEENFEDGSEAGSDGSDGSEYEEEPVALDDLEDGHVDEDVVPEQKVEIDNTVCVYPLIKRHAKLNYFPLQVALRRIREAIRLDPSLSWTETLVISYPQVIEADVDDDLNRELALLVHFPLCFVNKSSFCI